MYGYENENLIDGGDKNLVHKFNGCAVQFWDNGGIVFPVDSNNPGNKNLTGDPTGKLDKPGTFNKSPIEFKKFNRSSLAHNLVDIFEGITLAFANSNYEPFITFMRDSSGGITTLYYTGDRHSEHRTGDIVVDCGWTKLFYNITASGTFRYVQNIARWTAQCEYNRGHGINIKNYRPKAVVFHL